MFEELFTLKFLVLAVLCFLGSFIDSIAGGGGLITLPAYMASGLPPHLALGTNKMSGLFSSIGSSINYARSGKVNWTLMKYLLPFSFTGAFIGVKAVIKTSAEYISYIVFVALVLVFLYTLFNKKIGQENEFEGLTKKNLIQGAIMALVIGFYNGFLGPGTGSFLAFFLIKIFKYDFINGNGNARILNLAGNITGFLVFLANGKILLNYGIPISIVMFLGAQCGSHCAILKGNKFIKPIFLIVTVLTILKMFFQLF